VHNILNVSSSDCISFDIVLTRKILLYDRVGLFVTQRKVSKAYNNISNSGELDGEA